LDAATRAAPERSELAAALSGPAECTRQALASLLLRLGAIARGGSDQSIGALARSAADADLRFRAAGLTSASFVGPPPNALGDPSLLPTWLPPMVEWALERALFRSVEGPGSADGALGSLRDLGDLHQELLEVTVSRLDGAAVRIEPSDVWVPLCDVLADAPATRSRRLQRLAGLPKGDVERLGPALSSATTEADAVERLLAWNPRRVEAKAGGDFVVGGGSSRRRAGAHYTPPVISRAALERALAPLVEGRTSAELLTLTICDPAMGAGDFLREAALFLSEALQRAWSGEGHAGTPAEATARVVAHCLYGVDRDPIAVDCARWSLHELAAADGRDAKIRPHDLSHRLRVGDALVGSASATLHHTPGTPFHWHREFPEVFQGGGFHAVVGNPPWVAYAGRAAQPLERELAAYYERENAAFFGYRSLHGLFVRRAAELLREGGRLGLVLPTSVADLHGYAPARAAHDALCEPDRELLDFGDGAFEGVFQPCMALTSTRYAGKTKLPDRKIWQLARTDLDAVALGLLERLDALPRLDPSHFGERGVQTTGDDLSHLRHLGAAEPPFSLPLREGIDVAEFAAAKPTLFGDPSALASRIRPSAEFGRVGVLIRQTARFPIAASSDGVAFRNSILAGFGTATLSAAALVAYLNSSFVRFYHYVKHRDARQGMPQLKIGHLRALPAIDDPAARLALDALGTRLGTRNSGITSDERAELDALVHDALHLSADERALVAAWAEAHPTPRPRPRKTPN
jgi:hypothetical protein